MNTLMQRNETHDNAANLSKPWFRSSLTCWSSFPPATNPFLSAVADGD